MGGALLGALAGVILACALVTGMARLAYDFEPAEVSAEPPPGASQLDGRVVYTTLEDGRAATLIDDTRGSVEAPLRGSAFAAAFADVVDALPAEGLGFVPSDFKDALDILEFRIDERALLESQGRSDR